MAVLVRMTAAGMDTATYDKVSAELTSLVKKQPGFLMHVAYVTPEGFGVGEVWETSQQYQKWFEDNVKPNVPIEIKQEVIELHNVVQP
jgi:antibiotic biosynthesis monooxygenase (ABM) superfamily enzyme